MWEERVTDELGTVEVTTNGNHAATGLEEVRAGSPHPFDGRSIDERLHALLHTIHTWDWRASLAPAAPSVGTEAPEDHSRVPTGASSEDRLSDDTDATRAMQVPSGLALTPNQALDDQMAVVEPDSGIPEMSATMAQTPTTTPTTQSQGDSVATPELSPRGVAETVLIESGTPSGPVAPPTEQIPLPPEGVTPPAETADLLTEADHESRTATATPQEDSSFVEGTTSWFGHEPEARAAPESLLRRFSSSSTTRWVLLGVAAVVVVVLIIVGIRHFASNPGSAGPSVTTTTQAPTHRVSHNHFVAPISVAELIQYEGYAATFQSGNLSASAALAKEGNAPTAGQLDLALLSYRQVLNVYKLDLAVIRWPASMQTAIAADTAQLQQLASSLGSFGSVSPTGIPAWLSQFHILANSTQTDDNVVRRDLGLPASSAFP
jgi:hypothetical protein